MILGLNHIGVAPKDAKKFHFVMTEVLGCLAEGQELVEREFTLTHFYGSAADNHIPLPPCRIEALTDQPKGQGPIYEYKAKRGGGIHHLAFAVKDVKLAIETAKAKGIRVVYDPPKKGAHNSLVTFLHPESTGGILIELMEAPNQANRKS